MRVVSVAQSDEREQRTLVQAGRREADVHCVAARRNIDAEHEPVGAKNGYRVTVDGCVPAREPRSERLA